MTETQSDPNTTSNNPVRRRSRGGRILYHKASSSPSTNTQQAGNTSPQGSNSSTTSASANTPSHNSLSRGQRGKRRGRRGGSSFDINPASSPPSTNPQQSSDEKLELRVPKFIKVKDVVSPISASPLITKKELTSTNDSNTPIVSSYSEPITESLGAGLSALRSQEVETSNDSTLSSSTTSLLETPTLDLTDYESWNAEQVASLLISPKSLGGAGLSVEKVKPLYEAGFDGSSLHNIVENIKLDGVKYAIDQLQSTYNKSSIPQLSDTCQTVVFWVLDQLMTRQYSLWQLEPVSKQIKEKLGEPISKGGAELSLDQVSSLDVKTLSKVIAAVEKEIVKGVTEEKCMQYAITIMKSDKDFASVSEYTCKAVAGWITTKLRKAGEGGSLINIPSKLFDLWKHKLEGEISENLRKERTNARYDHLRNLQDPTNMKKLETLIGKFIDLPVFGTGESDLSPKGFNPNAKYLLTQQRFDILNNVVNGKTTGLVLSGPHGVSKSYTLYLIVAYAFVNSIPVLYVPRCRLWLSSYNTDQEAGANNYLRRLFFSLNSDILSTTQIVELQKARNVVRHLSTHFGNVGPMFYLFDEHNELYRPDYYNKIPASLAYFQDFTGWTGDTSEKHTVTVYCGSAHSSFEDNLPGGDEERVVRIIPPTTTEFETLVADFGLNPKDKRIAHVTGRIPRELRYLANYLKGKKGTDEDFNQFVMNMRGVYDRRLDLLVSTLDKNKLEKFEKTLEDLFALGILNGRPDRVSGVVYDKGLLYKDSLGKLFIINDPAKRCLFHHYCTKLDMPNIPKNVHNSATGIMFEKHLVRQEYGIGKHLERKFYVTNKLSSNPTTSTLSYEINLQESFDLKDLSTLDRRNFLKGTGVLFIPESETFPSFDYVIVMYKEKPVEVLLKQATISTIDSHYCDQKGKTDMDKLLKRFYVLDRKGKAMKRKQKAPKQYHFSLLELILHGIVGTEEKVETETLGKLQARKDDLKFIKDGKLENSVTYGGVQFTWHYIYESGAEEQSVKKVKEHGILFRNRQEIEADMKIYFEK
ncbi:hypothetical protein C9374_006530 [Naegleria lovaniensis]|uniref:Uncharacterized protein n=1 Tax=Naegleria lovaniensis TaxID=51637 RepID=A0AA88GIE2_NAELO|nr:uncharacterized protein C9374_006530 [Naegleria lovaniensis]KAG2381541.1 hypothetical protein C9374_006530 [Naegleria lovaniensis]